MNTKELVAHMRAYSATYLADGNAYREENMPKNAQFCYGKSEAFATAAAWLEEYGV